MTLTSIWLLPLIGAVLIAFMPPRFSKWMGVLVALVSLGIAAGVALAFAPGFHGYQFTEQVPWIPQLHVFYHLGVDGISIWLVLLNALLTVIAVLATPVTMKNVNRFIGLVLAMSAGMAGVFLAVDLVLFYVFWEATLLMLVGVIGEYVFTGQQTFDLAKLATIPVSSASIQFGLFFVFAIAFAIKVPLFPFHAWLPDAYMAAPTPMLVIFAGVMGKTGAYGMLRILVPLFPNPVLWWDWRWVIPALAVAAIIWGALMAIAQRDMKLLVAYSSVSHMGFIVLGIFAYNVQGQQGAILQMVNHGIIIPALFLFVAWIADRTGTRDRSALAGLAPRMPVLAGVFTIVVLAALGLPGLNSFVGEFMTLLGAWERAPVLAVIGAVGLVLAPVYMLRMFQGAMHGEPAGPRPSGDIYAGQLALVSPLIILMFAIGLYPYVLTQLMTSVAQVGLYR